jgi:ribosomal protein L37AE/L43A
MNDRIRDLEKQLEEERKRIRNCKHIFAKPYYNPDTIMEGYGSKQVGAGSDPYWEFEGYRPVENPRWTRKCTICGFEQHTRIQKQIIIGQEPNFE